MPLYGWKCKDCGQEVDVLRPFTGYLNPPTRDEEKHSCPYPGDCIAEEALWEGEHSWDRVISAPNITRGANWGGSKGNW